MSKGNEILGVRLKTARTEAALSQKELGIMAGLDEFVAGPRINRYEGGIHKADYLIAQRLAEVLDLPTAYFYTEEDSLAELIQLYHRMSNKKKAELLRSAKTMQG